MPLMKGLPHKGPGIIEEVPAEAQISPACDQAISDTNDCFHALESKAVESNTKSDNQTPQRNIQNQSFADDMIEKMPRKEVQPAVPAPQHLDRIKPMISQNQQDKTSLIKLSPPHTVAPSQPENQQNTNSMATTSSEPENQQAPDSTKPNIMQNQPIVSVATQPTVPNTSFKIKDDPSECDLKGNLNPFNEGMSLKAQDSRVDAVADFEVTGSEPVLDVTAVSMMTSPRTNNTETFLRSKSEVSVKGLGKLALEPVSTEETATLIKSPIDVRESNSAQPTISLQTKPPNDSTPPIITRKKKQKKTRSVKVEPDSSIKASNVEGGQDLLRDAFDKNITGGLNGNSLNLDAQGKSLQKSCFEATASKPETPNVSATDGHEDSVKEAEVQNNVQEKVNFKTMTGTRLASNNNNKAQEKLDATLPQAKPEDSQIGAVDRTVAFNENNSLAAEGQQMVASSQICEVLPKPRKKHKKSRKAKASRSTSAGVELEHGLSATQFQPSSVETPFMTDDKKPLPRPVILNSVKEMPSIYKSIFRSESRIGEADRFSDMQHNDLEKQQAEVDKLLEERGKPPRKVLLDLLDTIAPLDPQSDSSVGTILVGESDALSTSADTLPSSGSPPQEPLSHPSPTAERLQHSPIVPVTQHLISPSEAQLHKHAYSRSSALLAQAITDETFSSSVHTQQNRGRQQSSHDLKQFKGNPLREQSASSENISRSRPSSVKALTYKDVASTPPTPSSHENDAPDIARNGKEHGTTRTETNKKEDPKRTSGTAGKNGSTRKKADPWKVKSASWGERPSQKPAKK